MSEIIDYIGDLFNVFNNFISAILSIILKIPEYFLSTIDFITGVFNVIPTLFLNIFTNLPTFMQVGFNIVFTITFAIIVLKIFQLVKFW